MKVPSVLTMSWLAIACLNSLAATSLAEPRSPNIIVIFVDDMGYADIGPFGAREYRTPHLDRMAEQGMRLRISKCPRRCVRHPGPRC